jgi:hypothetical protein
MPDDLQPDQGQGDAGGGLFDSYLQTVPEDGRETVESYLKDASRNVESRLQEAADLKKTWEPYQPVQDTLRAYDPEQLQELLAWHQQVTSSDEAYQRWLGNAAKEAGLTPAEEDALEAAEATGELTREEIQKIIADQAEQRVAPLQERLTQFETEQAINAEEQNIRTQLEQLQAQEKIQLSESQKAMVLDLGMNAPGENWIKEGLDRFREITTEGQRTFVEQKTSQPSPTLTGGGAERFKPTTDWKEASEQARERLRQSQT